MKTDIVCTNGPWFYSDEELANQIGLVCLSNLSSESFCLENCDYMIFYLFVIFVQLLFQTNS